ncbi:flavin reductase family protein [Streptomyces sp. NPDC047081]|uniref:flavin reductase family protein n=1 Tax=Streptomyces sp. NPDC047081 TaxID=3154706 RepID=UPI0033E568DB
MTSTETLTMERFREAMSSFPSGVTIVTTADEHGTWRGFTASSFCSVSMRPPLVLVCLANTAECHSAFRSGERWLVHIISDEHTDLAKRFATRGADKFADAGFSADDGGLPLLADAAVKLTCDTYAIHSAGDHTILVGRVTRAETSEQTPTVYYRRRFHPLALDSSNGVPISAP